MSEGKGMFEGDGGDDGLTEEYRQRIFVGRAPNRDDPEPTLEGALKDAHRQAGRGTLRILETRVKGENPITDYIVVTQRED